MKNINNNLYSAQSRFDQDYMVSWLEPFVKEPVSRFECLTLKGDASDRSYFRVNYVLKSSPEKLHSLIVMQLNETNLKSEPDFNRMQKFLKHLSIPVPDIYHFDAQRGLLFLKDCGDTHLADKITEEPGETLHWYQKAIEIIVAFHIDVTENIKPNCPAHSLFFDEEKLMWEIDFMLEHYAQGMLKNILDSNKKNKIRDALTILCKALSDQERVFTHRDYHSRNIMIQNGELTVIDFQDARMGPCQYDLVSLLKDSYIVLDESIRIELLEYYISQMEKNGKEIARDSFYKIFDWMSVQRNLKAIGTFAYQYQALNNDRYLQYIEPTLNHIKQTLAKRKDLEFLIPVLNCAIPELGSTAKLNQ